MFCAAQILMSGERVEPDWKEKDMEEDAVELQSEKEPKGEVEEQEGEATPPPWSFSPLPGGPFCPPLSDGPRSDWT